MTVYTEVEVLAVLPNNQVYCSDGALRSAACLRRFTVGERVVVAGNLVYGHEWEKKPAVLEPVAAELASCPDNSILLIVRTSDGVHSHKYYFCI